MERHEPFDSGTLTIRSVRISKNEVRACLDSLDSRPSDEDSTRRKYPRVSYRTPNAILRPDREDKNVAFIVITRNVSVGGISVLHSQMMYPGTTCSIDLATRDGSWINIKATVAHCRLVRGMLHEIGLKFEHPIDLGLLAYLSVEPEQQAP